MTNRTKIIVLTIFAAAAFLRFADVFRPIDRDSWRECDLAGIARNFVLEEMNPFYPRVDWRGTTEGYAEMELPLYPFLIAITYEIFGFHEYIARIWALVFSIGTLFFFLNLSKEYLSSWGVIFGFAFFAFHPLFVEISTSIQSESLMFLCYVAGTYFFLRWMKTDQKKYFWLAIFATALAIMSKSTAAHIGLFFGFLLLQRYGFGVFRQGKVWILGILTLLPGVLWYLHAHSLWTTYGNSLGVSNEYHWIGLDLFTNSYFIRGIFYTELVHIWVIFGIVVGIFAVWLGFRENSVRYSLFWFLAILVMYFAAARTTAGEWAAYYHIFSIPPAALLFGLGFEKLFEQSQVLIEKRAGNPFSTNLKKLFPILLVAIAGFAALLGEAKQIKGNFTRLRVAAEGFACSREFKNVMKKEGLILASGGDCFDRDGYQLAYNDSAAFYWLGRKGFNICTEDQSLEKVSQFAAKGAKYFIARKSSLLKRPNFETELTKHYPVVSECGGIYVFDIEKAPPAETSGEQTSDLPNKND